MIQYLSNDAAIQQLKWGKSIEIFLGFHEVGCIDAIKYATLCADKLGDYLVLTIWICEDIGDANYIDIYSFPDADPDYEPEIFKFEYIEDAFNKICELGGSIDQFTMQFGLQEVYKAIKLSAQQDDAPEPRA